MTNFTDGTTSGVVTKDMTNLGFKQLQVRVPDTFVWGTDSLIIDLTDYGAVDLAGVLAFEETTEGSVTIQATEGTTSVTSAGVATIVSGGSGTNGGTFLIWAY